MLTEGMSIGETATSKDAEKLYENLDRMTNHERTEN